MKAKISKDGILTIFANSELEEYALTRWLEARKAGVPAFKIEAKTKKVKKPKQANIISAKQGELR